jgi:hypothetical protein
VLVGGQCPQNVDNYFNRRTIVRGQSLSMDNCPRKLQDPKKLLPSFTNDFERSFVFIRERLRMIMNDY